MSEETIAAIATPPGQGGVGILRVSGPLALSIGQKITHKNSFIPRQVEYVHFYDKKKEVIDIGVVIYFKGPKSFTGEDIIEFHGHGSPVALEMLLKSCVACGARMARPGEFSERAFLNDKIDLTQAEAIADLIASQSNTAAKMAVHSLKGEFSNKISLLVDLLIALRCFVEAAIDFPDEEIDFLSDGKVANDLQVIKKQLELVLSNARQGVIIRDGLRVVLAGQPNVGKSTLLNQLAGQDIAIVTDIAGTTRDVMRQHLLLDDIPMHVIDTAGLRQTDDVIEQEGVKRAWNEIKQADCILLIVDIKQQDQVDDLLTEVKQTIPATIPICVIINKVDLADNQSNYEQIDKNNLYISAKKGIGIEQLKQRLKAIVGYQPQEGQFIARSRHIDALNRAMKALQSGETQLLEFQAGELLAEDLRQAQQHLSEITGIFTADDLLGKIFSSFCIGK